MIRFSLRCHARTQGVTHLQGVMHEHKAPRTNTRRHARTQGATHEHKASRTNTRRHARTQPFTSLSSLFPTIRFLYDATHEHKASRTYTRRHARTQGVTHEHKASRTNTRRHARTQGATHELAPRTNTTFYFTFFTFLYDPRGLMNRKTL